MRQTAFAQALFNPALPTPPEVTSFNGSDPAQRFAVYRNNVMVSLIDGLAAKFPVVEMLVGTDFFRAMAQVFAAQFPPKSKLMALYGDAFPDFIDSFAPAASVPYLADVARLEVARVAAYHAADAPCWRAEDFAALEQESLFDTILVLQPGAQILSSRFAIGSIWATHQSAPDMAAICTDTPEAVLVCRPHLDVEVTLLPPGAAEFLQGLSQQQTISNAADKAFGAAPDFDLGAAFQILINSGVVCGVAPPQPPGLPLA